MILLAAFRDRISYPTGMWGFFFGVGNNFLPLMQKELRTAMEAAREAGQLILKHSGADVARRDKSGTYEGHVTGAEVRAADYDPVTVADEEADAALRGHLLGAFPEDGWLSEESTDSSERQQRSRVWIVDPIDGTKEFLEGIPEFVVSVALVEEGVPVVGVIYNPAKNQLYAATKSGGTFLNGKQVFCTEASDLFDAVLVVSRSEAARGEIDPLRPHLREVRLMGSAAYKLAVVAAGGSDLNVSVQSKNEWDVCAGDMLVREAGGRMLDLEGRVRVYNQPDSLIRGGLAAGNESLTQLAVDLIKKVNG
ncbi:MAG: 3'(2'),5'-bisphosphate nucleotidase CysQ [Candidatus Latescibacterota bacterium]|nr:3'(2'),5'-bisphosphate nucleotidase CysQ [Candidatus Latescibacterota bacterium]